MKVKNILYLLPVLVLTVGCKSKSSLVTDESKAITLQIEYTEQYCGGAAPTEEMEELMNQLRPYSNKPVYVSKFIDPVTYTDEIKVDLDKAGIATLNLDSGLYVVSFYKLVTPPPVVEDEKPTPDKTQDVPEDPNPEIDQEERKDDCEMRWKRMNATPLKIVGGKTTYTIPMNKVCNPCEEPRP